MVYATYAINNVLQGFGVVMFKNVLPAINEGKSFWNNEMQKNAAQDIHSTFKNIKFTTNLTNFADMNSGNQKDDEEYID